MATSIRVFDACMNGNIELINKLIKEGVDVNEPHFSTKGTPLHLASIAGKRRVVKILLKSGALVDAVDQAGYALLHHAVVRANVGTTRDLIKARADVNLRATNGQTPIALAAQKGFSDLVRMLLKHNADPDVANKYGHSALHDAVFEEHEECADILIRAGASQICLQTAENSLTALGLAIHNRRACMVRFLATHELVDVNATFDFNDNRSALMLAVSCSNGELPCVEALLKSNM